MGALPRLAGLVAQQTFNPHLGKALLPPPQGRRWTPVFLRLESGLLVDGAQKSWRRIDGHDRLPKLIQGVKFADGIEVIGNSAVPQAQAAA